MDQSPTPPHADPSEQPQQPQQESQPAGQQPQQASHDSMLSPDGLWRWDGTTWQPTGPTDATSVAARAAVRDAGSLVRWVVGAFAVVVLSKVIVLIALSGRLGLANRILNGETPPTSELDDSDNFVRLAAYLEVAVVILTAVVFLVWLHRVVANNRALGLRHLRFSPGWAVGWWFVPFANLVRPYQVMVENWKATDPGAADAEPYQPPSGPTPRLVTVWWLGFLLGYVAIRVYSTGQSGDGVQQIHDATVTALVATVLSALDAVLAALVAWRLTARQNALLARLRERAAAA